MTKLTERKTRLRIEFPDEIKERGRYRPITMEFTPSCIKVGLKGLRRRYDISPAAVYNRAALIAVERKRLQQRAEKVAKLERKKARQ